LAYYALCRLSLNPESCILRSADSFYRRGKILLVIAKFIPGINTMAPPLAGSMNMRFLPFFKLDVVGAALFVGAYFALGFAFSEVLEVITQGFHKFGQMMGTVVIALVIAYVAFVTGLWVRTRTQRTVPFVSPADAARDLATGAAIYDVRSHGYLAANAMRIRGSRRLDPNALHQEMPQVHTEWPVYVYCTCVREATSVRVAQELDKKGVRVAVIKGGLRGWKKAGLPLEGVPSEELAAFPSFA
jgi:rhodanese-related sulfurtransferase